MELGGPVLLILVIIVGALLFYKYATKEKESNYASYFVEDEDYDNSEYYRYL